MMSNSRKPFKNELPGNWEYKKAEKIFSESKESNRPELQLLSVTRQKGIIPQTESAKRDISSLNKERYKVIRPNYIVYNTMRMWQGVSAVSETVGIVSPAYTVLKPKENLNTRFIGYLFKFQPMINVFRRYSQGMVDDTLNLKYQNFKDILIPLPPIKEQQKIAAILSSVDEAIEKTEKIIEQTEKVKKGLMQELLTKGIGHTEFKDSPIGKIPTVWNLRKIEDVANTMSGGTPRRDRVDYYIGDIPWIKTGELKNKYLYETEECISELAIKESSAKLIPINSVIIAMYGATIGNLTINKIEATSNQACCSIIPDSKVLCFEFLYYILSFYKKKIISMGAGGAQPNISQQLVRKLFIPIPKLNEQKKIVNILKLYDVELEKNLKKRSQLSSIKQGLMQELLTGKKRVKIDDSEEVFS